MRPTLPLLLPLLALLGLGCPGGDDDDANDDAVGDDDVGDDDTAGWPPSDDDTGDDDSGDDDTGGEDADGDGVSVVDGDCNDADPALIQPGDGATLRVPSDHATIQAAIDAAASCDEVVVAAGTYAGTIDLQGKAIAVRGEDGPHATVLDGQGAGPVVTIASGEPYATRFEGFTVTGGVADEGAGVHVGIGSHPTLQHLIVTGCAAVRQTADPTILLEPGRGGGVFLEGSAAVLRQVVLAGNQANLGGGLYGTDFQGDVEHAVVAGNEAVAYVEVGEPDVPRGGEGGGLALVDSKVDLRHVALLDNHAHAPVDDGPQGGGGAAVLHSTSATLDHLAVVGNTAHNGAGLWVIDTALVVRHASVTGNDAANCGGGINVLGGTPTLSYTNVWGNTPTECVGFPDPTGSDGNLAVDPLLFDASNGDPLSWDLHLDPASPLIDAGDPATLDPDGSPADLGPYGGPGAGGFDLDMDGAPLWWHPGPYDPVVDPGEGWDCDDRDPEVFPGSGC